MVLNVYRNHEAYKGRGKGGGYGGGGEREIIYINTPIATLSPPE